MPRVTVLMPVYNGERFLREAIESILGQRFTDFEFLIINDGSDDSTRDIVLSYDDRRIRLVDNPQNVGLTESLNTGLRLARGDIIARQDADDISEPMRLDEQIRFLDSMPDVAVVGSWYMYIDVDGNVLGDVRLPCSWNDIRWLLMFECPLVHTAATFRKDIVTREVGYYDPSFGYAQDWDYWRRIAARLPMANVSQYLVRYRRNPTSLTATYDRATAEVEHIVVLAMADVVSGSDDWMLTGARVDRLRRFFRPEGSKFHAVEGAAVVRDFLALHATFCKKYRISDGECRKYRSTTFDSIGTSFLYNGHLWIQDGQTNYAIEAALMAIRCNKRLLLTKPMVSLLMKLAIGAERATWLRRRLRRWRRPPQVAGIPAREQHHVRRGEDAA